MKKCPLTTSGEHLWNSASPELAIWKHNFRPDLYPLPYKKCCACGFIDDRPTKGGKKV